MAAQRSGFLAKQSERLLKANTCAFCSRDHKPPAPKVRISKAADPTFRSALALTFGSRGLSRTPAQAVAAIKKAYRRGRKTLIISGDVGHSLPFLLEVLAKLAAPVAVVLASDPLYSAAAAKIFNRIIDVFALTMRWADPGCAEHFGEEVYVSTTQAAAKLAKGDIIVRIPIMPGHIECDAKAMLDWIAKEVPYVHVQLIIAHKPQVSLRAPELSRGITIADLNSIVEHAHKLGLSTESVAI
ncbi:MAG: radical SAM protein [Candidatus Aenigmatarchaeota archaeon]